MPALQTDNLPLTFVFKPDPNFRRQCEQRTVINDKSLSKYLNEGFKVGRCDENGYGQEYEHTSIWAPVKSAGGD